MQLGRVMHQRARGHEVEPKNSHFLCPKTKRSKTREKGATGESHARTYKRSQVEHRHSHFFMSKNKKKNKGERRNWREHARRCKRTRGRAQSLPFFILNNRKKLQSENHGLYTQYYEEICTHIFFFCAKMRRRKEKCALDSRENRNPAFVLLFFWKN